MKNECEIKGLLPFDKRHPGEQPAARHFHIFDGQNGHDAAQVQYTAGTNKRPFCTGPFINTPRRHFNLINNNQAVII